MKNYTLLLILIMLGSLLAGTGNYDQNSLMDNENVKNQYSEHTVEPCLSANNSCGNQTLYNQSGQTFGILHESSDGVMHSLMFWADNLSNDDLWISYELQLDIDPIYDYRVSEYNPNHPGMVTLDGFSNLSTVIHGSDWSAANVTLDLGGLVYHNYILSIKISGEDTLQQMQASMEHAFWGGNNSLDDVFQMTQTDCESAGHYWIIISNHGFPHCSLLKEDWLTLTLLDNNTGNLSIEFQYQWHHATSLSYSAQGTTGYVYIVNEWGFRVLGLEGMCGLGSTTAHNESSGNGISKHVSGGSLSGDSLQGTAGFCEYEIGGPFAENGTTRGKLFDDYQFPCGNLTINYVLNDNYALTIVPRDPRIAHESLFFNGVECAAEELDMDGDMWTDVLEIECNTSIDNQSSFPVDTDNDGVCNYNDEDDDGDGVSDSDELAAATNPLDATSKPLSDDTTGESSGIPGFTSSMTMVAIFIASLLMRRKIGAP